MVTVLCLQQQSRAGQAEPRVFQRPPHSFFFFALSASRHCATHESDLAPSDEPGKDFWRVKFVEHWEVGYGHDTRFVGGVCRKKVPVTRQLEAIGKILIAEARVARRPKHRLSGGEDARLPGWE